MWSSVEVLPEGYSFFLPGHKADRFFEGNCIIVAKNAAEDEPYSSFLWYLASCDHLSPQHPELWMAPSLPMGGSYVNFADISPLMSWVIQCVLVMPQHSLKQAYPLILFNWSVGVWGLSNLHLSPSRAACCPGLQLWPSFCLTVFWFILLYLSFLFFPPFFDFPLPIFGSPKACSYLLSYIYEWIQPCPKWIQLRLLFLLFPIAIYGASPKYIVFRALAADFRAGPQFAYHPHDSSWWWWWWWWILHLYTATCN